MSKLLEIFGRAITVNTADVIWHWLNATLETNVATEDRPFFEEILDLLANLKQHLAVEKINQYLDRFPESTYARMAAVVVCLRRNQLDEAIEQLNSVYLRQPSNTMALYSLGYCYEILGKEAQAVDFYMDSLKFKHYLQLPRQRLAAIYFKNGRIENAIQEYEMLRQEYPDDVNSVVILGYLHLANLQYDQAIDVFNNAITIHPDNFHMQTDPEEIEELILTGQHEDAIEKLTSQMEQIGQMPDLLVRIGDIYAAQNIIAEAISHYQKAARIFPSYLEAVIKLGSIYLRCQHHSSAAEQFNRAVEINDEIVDSYIGLATAQELAGERQDALDTLSLAGAVQQNSSLLFAETATLQYQSSFGKPNDKVNENIMINSVIEAHYKLVENNQQSSDAHYKLGLLIMAAGDFEKAAKFIENAMNINPSHHRAKSKTAICYFETGNQEQALSVLTSNIELDCQALDLHYKTALLYCNDNRFDTAVSNLRNSIQDKEQLQSNLTNIAVVLESLGMMDRAFATWDRLSKTYEFSMQHKAT